MWIAHDRQPGCSPSIETASYATNSSDSSFAPRSNGPAPAALRRVLRRTRDGVALNVDGAAVALTARGDDLADLCTSAGRVREAGLPLPFVHQSSPPYLARAARPGPTHRDNRAVHALARIMLHGRISNIQTSWVKLGVERTQIMLQGGANDLGGTLMEETISRMAGSEHGSVKTVQELVEIAAGIGRPARQRTTTYAETPPKPERPLRPVCGQRR